MKKPKKKAVKPRRKKPAPADAVKVDLVPPAPPPAPPLPPKKPPVSDGVRKLRELRAMKRRAASIFKKPDALEEVFEHVANGGSLVSLCRSWRILHSSAIAWLYEDRGRQERYEVAQRARGEYWIQRVLEELETVALTDIREAFDEVGRLKPVHEMPAAVARAISSIEVEEMFEGHGAEREQVGQVKKLKLWDKMRANELLGKKLKMFIDRLEVAVTGSLANDIEKGRKRAAAAAAAAAAAVVAPPPAPAGADDPHADDDDDDDGPEDGDKGKEDDDAGDD